MKTACVSFAMGCYRSRMDAALFVDYFKANGWRITTSFGQADIILFGSCGLNNEYERMSTNYLSMAKERKKNGAPIVVFGCLAGINREMLVNDFDAIPLARKDMDSLDSMINATKKLNTIKDPNDLSSYLEYIKGSFSPFDWFRAKCGLFSTDTFQKIIASVIYRVHESSPGSAAYSNLYDIRIATGCMGACSYCAIKFESGHLSSKPLDDVLAEFRRGLSEGFKVFRLVAEDVGAYGQENGTNIVELLNEIYSHKEDFKLIFNDFSPRWFLRYQTELTEIFAKNCGRIGYIALPMQSGSEKILKSMKRGYTAESARKAISTLMQACPNLDMNTHLIVGFPGETEADFMDSLNFVKTVPFKMTHIFKYSDRPGTVASKLPDKISEKTKTKRVWALMRALKPGKASPAS